MALATTTLDDCQHELMDAGVNAYMHYVSYVQQLCIRLTQEYLMQQQHATQQAIMMQYALLSDQMVQQLQQIHDMT